MRRLRGVLLLVVTLTLQHTLLGQIGIAGAHPDAMLLIPIVVGLLAGPEAGALAGFSAGVTVDLFLQTPLGLSALSYSLVGFIIGSLQSSVLRSAWWITPAIAAAASLVGVLLFAVLGATVGVPQMLRPSLLVIGSVVAGVNALLAPPASRAWRWALARPLDRSFAR